MSGSKSASVSLARSTSSTEQPSLRHSSATNFVTTRVEERSLRLPATTRIFRADIKLFRGGVGRGRGVGGGRSHVRDRDGVRDDDSGGFFAGVFARFFNSRPNANSNQP